ncbi:MAG: 6-carboxytetrahydropterin synthase QueD [Kiritimatiellae bacterium]|nr:6-carboxytetrahydropterin synthase QueD [Kiritimatiellia bacterium]
MLIITKTISFDAAHLLTGHGGQCKNLHGHTYRVEVELGNTPPLAGQPVDMVMDFKELKAVLQEEIVAPCDHAFLYDRSSPVESDIAATLIKHGLRVYPMCCRTTSENLAQHFFKKIADRGLPVTAVSVSETPESCATYRNK